MRGQSFANARSNIKFDSMALAVGKTDRLDPRKSLQRPSKANSRILSARKQDKRAIEDLHRG
jgi:hypothetical protein